MPLDDLRRARSALRPGGPPTLAFVRRAPAGIRGEGGTLLCLSASFNPVTLAHLELIQAAAAVVTPDEVLLLLSLANVDKDMTGLPLERRVRLLLALAESRSAFSVALASHGRFLEKLAAIRAAYPDGIRPVFLLGFDTLLRLFDARYYADRNAALATLFAGSRCLAANRAPHSPGAVAEFLARPEVAPYADRIGIVKLPGDLAAVSATEVRRRLARGEPVADLVPPEILPLLRTV
jgi:nicotinic acid mononucleotide adenylyltransferase